MERDGSFLSIFPVCGGSFVHFALAQPSEKIRLDLRKYW